MLRKVTLLAKEVVRRVPTVDYPLLIASAYSGFVIWHAGLSGSKRFASIPILQTELLYCVAKDHRLAEKEVIELADLKEEPLVLMKRGSYQNKEVLRRFQEQGIQPNILLRTEQLYTIEQYILRQEAGGFLFKEIAACNREITGIAVQPKIPISVHLIWDKNKQTPHSAAEFIRFAHS